MDIRQLHYFIAIVECGSFSRAAQQLHVAQPALSQHVRAMETLLGVRLLHRNPRGVVPTEAGVRLAERAREIERGSIVPRGEVRFGMPATINEQLGVALIEAGQKLYPEIRIRISEAMSGFVLDWLRTGVVDVALLYNVADEKGLILHHALTEEIRLFAPPGMTPTPAGDSVTLSAALRLPLILPGSAHGLRDLLEAAAQSLGKAVSPAIEIDSYRQIKQLTARGLGFGILPATAVKQEVASGEFRAWRILRPGLTRRIHLGYPANRPLSSAARAISQLSWEILERQVRSGGWVATWGNQAPFV